ncbi:bifunctional adenosylcobinamide kinase/adenosylcobinamide-phosphate guanylyltransferase [Phaeovibrio sulfidiphilus]|uniref:Bifunctional adenosylcobalamin biosynthesis protein n=2 Tax=Phaeovibrio sulfidiphilus TaxID=1220600 RepID=A0A8J6YJT4_9PROT|nr:bifunctional adenosylcobinamide kinase/adenosylcobinamide-phosphate guanylyltransferase [Phaeovibrio sulfidiphilus]MBE1237701.1 bifunctional adenosylcobinamide kinase/adenosylcobinamide-phosphate guanylyltransferase [Phaeovibrio sulfidiphilus]
MGASPEALEAGNARLTLVLGGARSGKSALAERLCRALGGSPLYLATAPLPEAGSDSEMTARIAAHREQRAAGNWETVEAGRALPDALLEHATNPERPVLVDCVVLWLGTLMMDAFMNAPGDEFEKARQSTAIEASAREALVAALDQARAPVFLVSGEVGLGVVPPTPLGRAFQDVLGRMNQALAARADRVLLTVAGIPVVLKDVP